MSKNRLKLFFGFIYRPHDGYLRLSDGKLGNDLPLDDHNINKALKVLKQNNLKKLSFGTPFQKNQNIEFLDQFNFLKGIEIGLDNFEIEPIHNCIALEEITITSGFKGRINFSKFQKLKKIYIKWRNPGVETLYNCENLEKATLLGYSEMSLLKFEAFPNLKELGLTRPKIISVNGIEFCSDLRSLEIEQAKGLTDINDIQNLVDLESLILSGTTKLQDLTPIIYLKNLKTLSLENFKNLESIMFLRALKKLEQFFMDSTNLIDGNLEVLEFLRENHNLVKIIFNNRPHYSHTKEELGYKLPPELLEP